MAKATEVVSLCEHTNRPCPVDRSWVRQDGAVRYVDKPICGAVKLPSKYNGTFRLPICPTAASILGDYRRDHASDTHETALKTTDNFHILYLTSESRVIAWVMHGCLYTPEDKPKKPRKKKKK